MSALFNGIDEPLRLVYFLFGVQQRFLFLPVHVLLVVLVGVYHVGKRWRDGQLWNFSLVQCERYVVVVIHVDDKVGRDLLDVPAHGLAH